MFLYFVCHIVQRKTVNILNFVQFSYPLQKQNKTLQNPSNFATFIFLEAYNTKSEAHYGLGICGRADTKALIEGKPKLYCFLTKCFCYRSYITTNKNNND